MKKILIAIVLFATTNSTPLIADQCTERTIELQQLSFAYTVQSSQYTNSDRPDLACDANARSWQYQQEILDHLRQCGSKLDMVNQQNNMIRQKRSMERMCPDYSFDIE